MIKIETRIIAARHTRIKIHLLGKTINRGMRMIRTKHTIVPSPDAIDNVAEVFVVIRNGLTRKVSEVREIKTVNVSTVAISITSPL